MQSTFTRWITVLVFGSAVLGSMPAVVAADTADSGQHNGRGARFQQWLGLTDDQMNAIRQIRQQDAPAMKQQFQAMRQARMDLRQAVLNGADPATIQAKQAAVQTLMAQGLDLRVKNLQQIAPVLTPDQRAKLASANADGRWRRHRGQGTQQPNQQ